MANALAVHHHDTRSRHCHKMLRVTFPPAELRSPPHIQWGVDDSVKLYHERHGEDPTGGDRRAPSPQAASCGEAQFTAPQDDAKPAGVCTCMDVPREGPQTAGPSRRCLLSEDLSERENCLLLRGSSTCSCCVLLCLVPLFPVFFLILSDARPPGSCAQGDWRGLGALGT